MRKKSISRITFEIINLFIISFYCLLVIIPMWMVFMTSLAPDSQAVKEGYVLIPKSIEFKYFIRVLKSGYMDAFIRSIIIAAVGTLFSMNLTLLTGYVLAQKELVGRRIFLKIVIIPMIFESGVIPFYIVVRALGLINTYASLILPVALSTYNLILVKNYMSSISPALMESARIDGCTEIGILFRIILPVSVPIIAAISLFYAVYYWNMYFEVVMFINKSSKYTLQVLLRQLIFDSESVTTGTEQIFNNFKMTVMIMTMLPVLVLYPYIQKYFITGIMLGSIKG